MDLAKIGEWMQIFATFAVVASLIFIGLQMQQTQAIAITNQYQERAALNADWRMATLQSETALAFTGSDFRQQILNSEYSNESISSIESLSAETVGYRFASAMFAFLVIDNNHFQYQSGFLTADTWEAYKDELKVYLRSELMQIVWEETKHQYRADFRNVVEQLIAENRKEG